MTAYPFCNIFWVALTSWIQDW